MIARLRTAAERAFARLVALFGRGLVVAMGGVAAAALLVCALAFGIFDSAAPGSLTITAGPEGSNFSRTAEQYRKILARSGITLHVLPSEGSRENLARLADPKVKVDVGFVLGGQAEPAVAEKLLSLGSVAHQPLMVFYRGTPRSLLSDFRGLRLDIGPAGSGSNVLARALLAANGIVDSDSTMYASVRESLRDAHAGQSVTAPAPASPTL